LAFPKESLEPSQGTLGLPEEKFKATFPKENLEPPWGTLGLPQGKFKATFLKENSEPPWGTFGFPWEELITLLGEFLAFPEESREPLP